MQQKTSYMGVIMQESHNIKNILCNINNVDMTLETCMHIMHSNLLFIHVGNNTRA